MKILLIIVLVMLVSGLLWADYRWRRWLAARQRERNAEQDRGVN